MFNLFSSSAVAYKSLSGKEFKEEYSKSKQAVLIDVRTPGEFASGSIDKAKNIDVMSPDFKKRLSTRDKNKEYFIFCRSGGRSSQACSLMSELGFKVYNLKGGVGAWPG